MTGRNKISICRLDDIVHKNSKLHTHTHTHTILELISEFNKVAGYKIDIERQIVFYILSVYHTKIKLRKQFYLKYYQKN